ncbi:MAG: glycosyl hydrolase, partial [Bacteroidota bacterium]
ATFNDGKRAKLKQIWCMSHGGSDQPDVLWLGTEPGGLFKSIDGGESCLLVKSLWTHPSRQKEGQWFGAGSDQPFIHSIEIDPRDSNHLYIAVSCAGVFETRDGGHSWAVRNRGLVATYLPNPNVEVGHDPHRVLISSSTPDVLWQQNHCGIFYSKDQGASWQDVSVRGGVPYYGFALAVDEDDPAKAWVIPVESDEQRIAPSLQLQIFKTENWGEDWAENNEGLPEEPTFDIVLRHSFAKLKGLLIFGTTNGNLYYRDQTNAPWKLLNNSLTKVNSVQVIVV